MADDKGLIDAAAATAPAFNPGGISYTADPTLVPRLKDGLFYGVMQQPDSVAEMRRFSEGLGVPPIVASGDPKYVQAQGRVAALDPNGMAYTSPKTADWLAHPDNAAIAHDDVPVLKQIEGLAKDVGSDLLTFGRKFPDIAKGGLYGLEKQYLGMLRAQAENPINDSPFGLFSGAAKAAASLVGDVLGAGAKKAGDKETALTPQFKTPVGRGLAGGVQSIEQNVPGMVAALVTGNPAAAIYMGAQGQAGAGYEDAREAGKSPVAAGAFGAGQGLIEAAGEMLPMHVLFGDLHAGSSLWKTLGHQIITEVPTEEATQHLQDLNEWLTLHPEKTLGDYLKEEPDRIITTALATMVQAGAMGTAMHVGGKALGMAQVGQERAQAAQEQAQGIGDMMKAAEASALRKRDPQTFQQYVDHVTADTPAEFVYISANDLVNTLAQGSPEQIAQNTEIAKAMPSVPGQLQDALPSNGLVRIPISELLAYTPETPLAQSLIEHLKVDPEGYTMKESEAFMQSKAEELKADVQKTIEQATNKDEFAQSADKVHAAILDQLNKANRYTADTNATLAMLPTAFYATMAQRQGTNPETLYAAHTMTVQAAGIGPDALHQFAGEKAIGYPAEALDRAKKMEAKGELAGDIEDATGWRRGDDQKWRFEISDHDSALNREGVEDLMGNRTVPLDQVLKHDRLFNAYPQLRTLPVLQRPKLRGNAAIGFMPDGQMAIAVSPHLLLDETKLRPTLLHEVQHAIQNVEGFAQGTGASEEALRRGGYGPELDAAADNVYDYTNRKGERVYNGTREQALAGEVFNVYQRSAGEIEARNTAARADMTPAQRGEVPGEYTRDIPRSRSIVRFVEDFQADELHQDALYPYEPGLGFQSALYEVVRDKGQAKASADQWLATLKNAPGVKKEEIEWIGLPEALKLMGAQGPVTREQVLAYIAQNGVRIEERVLGGALSDDEIYPAYDALVDEAIGDQGDNHFAEQVDDAEEEGGEGVWRVYGPGSDGRTFESHDEAQEYAQELNDAEMDDLREQANVSWEDAEERARDELGVNPKWSEYQAVKGGENYREITFILPKAENPTLKRDFTARMGHWDDDNVLAHTRLSDFMTPDGKRVLLIQEVQSDWHQKGRDKGYSVPASKEEQEAATAAYDAATRVQHERGEALLDIFEPLYHEQLEALRGMRDRARNLHDDMARKANELAAQLDALPRLSDTAPEAMAHVEQLQAAYDDAQGQRRNADIAGDRLADRINRLQTAGSQIFRHQTGEMYRGEEHTWSRVLLLANRHDLWVRDGGYPDGYGDMLEAATELENANLKRSEADQRRAQTQGQTGIPDAPFKASWPDLVLKRVLKLAVEEGYDHVAWATGEQQADLYDMRQRLSMLRMEHGPEGVAGGAVVRAFDHNGYTVVNHNVSNEGELRDLLGAELSARFLAQTPREAAVGELGPFITELTGDDLEMGGEGHKAFYNRNLVNIANKLIKRFDAKVGPVELRNPEQMRNAAGQMLQPLTAMEQATLEEARRPETPAPRPPSVIRAEAEEIANADPTVARHLRADGTYAHPRLEELRNEMRLSQAVIRYAELEEGKLVQWGFPITEKMRTEDAATQPKLFQGDNPTTARGAFNPQTNTITLLKGADLSTFLHESGHFFLETLARIAAEPNASQELRDDWDKASKFIGWGGTDPAAWLAIPVDARREGHEKWARGFEAYLREGKAPAPQLQGVFHRFRGWLLHIYQNLAQLNVELTDEVRGVFDRMLATDVEIAQAQHARSMAPVFTAKPEGMSDTEWEAYQRLGEQATQSAQDELQGRSIRDMQWLQNTRMRMIRKLSADAREKRKAVRAEVENEVRAEPVYRASEFLKRGAIDGEPSGLPHKLSIQEVEAIYADNPGAPWQRLGYGKYGMLADAESDNAIHPDQAAELFGFSSGDELVRELLAAHPIREEIEGRTDQRMLERYGDLTDPQAIAKAADEAIHNDARLRFVATEANALAKAAGSKRILAEAARNFAQELIARQKVRDLRASRWTGAETKAAAAAAKAAAKGDLKTAATEKRNQLINAYAARAAYEAQGEVDKALRLFDRLQSKAAVKSIDPSYREQIDQLLERYDLRKGQSLRAIDKRTSLAAWVKAREAAGLPPPVISDDLLDAANRKHFKDMTVEEMRGLRDAVQNIAHLGRMKNKLLVAARGRAFQAVVDDGEAMIRDNAYKTLPQNYEQNTVMDSVRSGIASFFAIHRKFASLIREMSGFKGFEGGVLWRAFIEPMNAANDREASMRAAATQALGELYNLLPLKKDALRQKMFIPEIGRSLSLEGRIAVALNWGNEVNRARVMDGFKWSQEQTEAVLRTLTPQHLDFVNRMWAHLDSYWPEAAALERRVNGIEPEKVQAEPFDLQLADGTTVSMRGGYYPIAYNTSLSMRADANEKAEALKQGLAAVYSYGSGMTRQGHLKARVDKVERAIRLDLLVPFKHVTQVIHDLSFREYLIDANRLIRAPQIEAAIRDHYGAPVLKTIHNVLGAIGEGDQPAADVLEKAVNYIRTGSTMAGLGFNLVSAIQQPLGLAQSVARIGPKYMVRGVGKAFADAATLNDSMKMIAAKSDFMRLRAQTLMREVSEIAGKVQQKTGHKVIGALPGGDALASGVDALHGGLFYLTAKLQLVADVPTWLGAYDKAQANGEDEETSVHLADQAVRDSQGSGQMGDLAQIQRGGAWFKLWTNFYSFFNVAYNQLAESVAETRRVGPSRLPILAADFLLVAVVPSVFGDLLKHLVRGDDWDQWDKIAASLGKAQVAYLLGFMVGARELGTIITSDGKGPAAPAGLRLLTDDLPALYRQIEQGQFDDSLRRAILNTAGVLTHMPSAQLNRVIDGIEALAKGETNNPLAPLFGPPQVKKAH